MEKLRYAATEGSRDFASFCNCEMSVGEVKATRKAARSPAPGGRGGRSVSGKDIMDDSVQKSCWGVAAKAVVGFAFIILLAWLIGGVESAAVVAAR